MVEWIEIKASSSPRKKNNALSLDPGLYYVDEMHGPTHYCPLSLLIPLLLFFHWIHCIIPYYGRGVLVVEKLSLSIFSFFLARHSHGRRRIRHYTSSTIVIIYFNLIEEARKRIYTQDLLFCSSRFAGKKEKVANVL